MSIRHRPPSPKRWRLGALLLVGLLLVAAFVGAGCGGDDEGSDETGVEQSRSPRSGTSATPSSLLGATEHAGGEARSISTYQWPTSVRSRTD